MARQNLASCNSDRCLCFFRRLPCRRPSLVDAKASDFLSKPSSPKSFFPDRDIKPNRFRSKFLQLLAICSAPTSRACDFFFTLIRDRCLCSHCETGAYFPTLPTIFFFSSPASFSDAISLCNLSRKQFLR